MACRIDTGEEGRPDGSAPRRLSLRLLPLAMAASLLGTSPAYAADGAQPPTVPLLTDRGKVVESWLTGGPGVKAAAEAALLGTDADVRKFLDGERAVAQVSDDQVSAAQIHALGGVRCAPPRRRRSAERPRSCAPSWCRAGRSRSSPTSRCRPPC
ncbi:ALF repeat-containing protein [Kitasatospora aburaviensis]